VLPTIKVDADSRNIEELARRGRSDALQAAQDAGADGGAEAGGFTFKDYEGMMAEMKKGTLVIDDISHHEIEKLIEIYKPDIIGSGIKDKFVIEKMGVPCKQLHSYDYSGPYAAFTGAANFYREVDRMVNTKVWKLVTPPWEKNRSFPPAWFIPRAHRRKRNEKRSQILAQTGEGAATVPG
jgi:nitrogenase molybdenum-iron protein alpha chain